MSDFSLLDFKVAKEYWDSYELNDGTILKSRVILTGVKKSVSSPSKEYEFGFQSIQSFIFSDKSRGPPHNKMFTKEELESSYKKEISFSTLSEKWNEYLINDNTKVKLKSTVSDITKSDLFLQSGEPIYNVKIRVLSKVVRPKKIGD